jgi:hypothetical protein
VITSLIRMVLKIVRFGINKGLMASCSQTLACVTAPPFPWLRVHRHLPASQRPFIHSQVVKINSAYSNFSLNPTINWRRASKTRTSTRQNLEHTITLRNLLSSPCSQFHLPRFPPRAALLGNSRTCRARCPPR